MKITLISLPNPTLTDPRIAPPLGLLYLASYVLKHYPDWDIKVIDLNTESLHDVIWDDADIFGISIASTQLKSARKVGEILRKVQGDSHVVIGGPHPTTLPMESVCYMRADNVVVGEGEVAFLDFCTGNYNDLIIKRDYIKDLDTIPFPARELLDFSKYTRTIAGQAATNMITSRGCPGQCTFCDQDVWGNKLRFHSAEYVLAEIDDIKKKTGIDRILFLDDTLTFNRERMFKICRGLYDRDVLWRGWTRANCIDEILLASMFDTGCHSLCLGVESGSPRILKNIKKGITPEQNLAGVKMIHDAGILTRISLMIGCPGETHDTIQETKDWMKEAAPFVDDWIVSTFVPVVGSPAWKNPQGFRLLDAPYEDYYVVGYDQKSGTVMELDTMSNEVLASEKKDLIEYLHKVCPRKPEEVVK